MPPDNDRPKVCRWVSQADAFEHFAGYSGPTQSQQHIKPLHWYVACRLVLEGGFHPDEVTPRPPFALIRRRRGREIHFDPGRATGGEATILGGLKTKNVDVVVNKGGIGPVLAVSCKGMIGALRNLTNRMEETIGECTNLHIAYPALVLGYLFAIRANRLAAHAGTTARRMGANDIAVSDDGSPVQTIVRFHSALSALAGRRGIREDASRYEAIALSMIDTLDGNLGQPLRNFPPAESLLRLDRFFNVLYTRYDERYVYSAPDLSSRTRRYEWSPESPILECGAIDNLGYEVRLEG